MELTERARLGHMVIGPERLEKLTARCADGLVIRHGMTVEGARKYAQDCIDALHAEKVIRIGQVWSQRDGETLTGVDALASLTGRKTSTSYTVVGFTDDGMVKVDDGRLHLNISHFTHMWLTAWPEEFDASDVQPEPPKEPIADDAPEGAAEPPFDPRSLWITATRLNEEGLFEVEGLPLLSSYYRAVNWKKPEYEPFYGNALDVPAYLEEHLADYRAGWDDFRERFSRKDAFDYFNALDGGTEHGITVSAYLGEWLWQRVRSDVVTEHGGTVEDYSVMFEWSPGMFDVVFEAAPYADPEWEIPADHRLAQCDGQIELPVFAGVPAASPSSREEI